MSRHVVISGCSGGGKSTLLAELARRGFAVVPEPGRRIVEEEIARGGSALPWTDLSAFARRAIAIARLDKAQAPKASGWVFFDRSLIDAAAALAHAGGEQVPDGLHDNRYHRRVFFTPPWSDIFESDPERRHGFDEAVAEHGRLRTAYHALGYEIVDLPKVAVSDRADFVLASL
jgi:predicted ATPase